MSDDYDYVADEEPVQEYDDYEVDMHQQNDNTNELENMLYNGEETMKTNINEAIEIFQNIIQMEQDNPSGSAKYTFKSNENMSVIYLRKKDITLFETVFDNLMKNYESIDDADKQDTIRRLSNELFDLHDDEFALAVYRKMIDVLIEKEIGREVLNAGVKYSKILFGLGKTEQMGEALNEILDYLQKNIRSEDEMTKSSKLELLVLKIQYCNATKNPKESKRLYLEAAKLNEHKTIADPRLSAIIDEEGGKLFMSQKDYDQALEKFKSAFYLYQETGSDRARILLKYAYLTSIISRSRKNIVSVEEARHYSGDQQLKAMLSLRAAYEDSNISLINKIWNEQISRQEDDSFIITHLNDILHNIRFNYICSKMRAYRVCRFSTLITEMAVDKSTIISLLYEIVLSESLKAKINLVKETIELVDLTEAQDRHINNLKNWLGHLNNQ